MAQKPSIPKGTRDFSPSEVAKRQYLMHVIKTNFEKYGYQPIETPSFENSETLMGKYGEEGDRLIFKILDNGEFFESKLKNDFFDQDRVSVYIAVQKVFRNIATYIVSKKLSEKTFTTIKEFSELKNDQELVNLIRYDFNQWTTKNIFKNRHLGIAFENILNKNLQFVLDRIVEFIRMRGLDFQQRRSEEFIEQGLLIADYTIIKKLSDLFIQDLEKDFDLKSLSAFIAKEASEKALRYDLTVPFARYVVQHQNDIEFPFKRYQIQPVWRADRPQKGRFREFYQCDADVVGSTSLWQEVELVQLYDAVFSELGLKGVTIKINNRKILSGIADVIGAKDKLIDFTVALDKLDKIGEDGVRNEMLEKGISQDALQKVQPLFHFTGSISEKLEKLSTLLASSDEGMKGLDEVRFICENVLALGLDQSILDLDVTLARGLNYYTGAIFEVAPPATVSMGSVGGGGRYDDLTGIFGLKNMSGVGISFGLDRIYLVVEELGLFPETVASSTQALFLNYGNQEAFYAMAAIKALRASGIKTELYPDNSKIDKQFKYAERRRIPFVVMAGSDEIAQDRFKLKNLDSGEQHVLDLPALKQMLSK